jgi:hypothetical protein
MLKGLLNIDYNGYCAFRGKLLNAVYNLPISFEICMVVSLNPFYRLNTDAKKCILSSPLFLEVSVSPKRSVDKVSDSKEGPAEASTRAGSSSRHQG